MKPIPRNFRGGRSISPLTSPRPKQAWKPRTPKSPVPACTRSGSKFNWQKAEGAIQFNLVLDNAESLFPGYYVKITDIRVNGKSIDHKPNLYGTFHDDPNAGFAPIYNNYWDKNFCPDSTGSGRSARL